MIIVRSPLRISLGGGGTDLPSYYREYGGFLIAAAIDKYVYVTVMRPFVPGIYLKYSKLERVERVEEVQHPIIREALRMMELRTPQVEITTLADIPAGTGLGSSGSFTTALIKALYTHHRRHLHPEEIASMACDIEINRLGEPIGKQDQYIAAFGGVTAFYFHQDDRVEAQPLRLRSDILNDLSDSLLLFFTGFARSASAILQDQQTRTQQADQAMIDNLHYVKELGLRSMQLLQEGKLAEYGLLMHEHWEHKRKRSAGMSNTQIDAWYELGRRNGALGGKLVGAGGGGFLLFVTDEPRRLRTAMRAAGLEEVRFRFDFEGTKVIAS